MKQGFIESFMNMEEKRDNKYWTENEKEILLRFDKLYSATKRKKIKWSQLNPLTYTSEKDDYAILLKLIAGDVFNETIYSIVSNRWRGIDNAFPHYKSNDGGENWTSMDNVDFKLMIFQDNENAIPVFSIGSEEGASFSFSMTLMRKRLILLHFLILKSIEDAGFDAIRAVTDFIDLPPH